MIATRVAKSSDDLAKYGVAIKDTNGELRSTYDILVDLKPEWDKMSSAEKVALGQVLAGTNQYKIFAAVMSQMDTAVEAYNDALGSSGATMKQNEIYMQSLEAKVTALKAEFEKFVIGKGGLQDAAKWFVEAGTSALEFVNKIGGLRTVLITITSLLIAFNSVKIYQTILTTVDSFQTLITTIPRAITAWQMYNNTVAASKAGIQSANIAMEATVPIIGWVVAAIGLATAAILTHNQHLEEQKQKIRDTIVAFNEEYKALEDVSERLQDENISREELNDIINSNLDNYDAERIALLNNNDARKETIDLIEKEKEARAQELVDTGLTEYEESLDKIRNGYEDVVDFTNDIIEKSNSLGAGVTQALSKSGLAAAKTADAQEKALTIFKQEIINLRNEQKEGSYEWEKYNLIAKDTESTLITLKENIKSDNKIIQAFNEALKTLGLRYDETTNKIEEGASAWGGTLAAQEAAIKKTQEATKYTYDEQKSLDDLKEQYHITDDAIYDYIEAHQEELEAEGNSTAAYYAAIEALVLEKKSLDEAKFSSEELSKASSQLESEISSLATALTEQENNGSIALKTQLQLIDAGYALALAYDEETGACKLDTEAVQTLVEAKLQQQIANLRVAESNLVGTLVAEANAAVTAAGSFTLLAKAKGLANEASLEQGKTSGRAGDDPSKSYGGFGGNAGYLQGGETRKQYDALEGQIKALETSLTQIGKVGVKAFSTIGQSASKAGKSAGSAAKSTKDATKKAEEAKKKAIEETTQAIQKQINALDEEIAQIDKQTEAIQKQISALEKTKSEYERVFSFITKKIEDRIKEIEAEKDAAVQASEAIVKAKEKEKDTILAGIEAEISALEEAKEAREKYWDEEIDALKNKNKEYKESLELQEKLDALEKAKNTKVKVYKKGQGFVYDVDQTEVQKAQKELDEYLKERDYEDELEKLENLKNAEIENYNTRINELNKFKDKTQKTYEEEIKNLEANTKALEQQYDEQIAIYQGYKTEFENMLNAYQESQDELLAAQLTGINFENDNWMTRISNLQSFVDNYTAGIREIERLNEEEVKLNAEKARLAEEREELQRRLNEAKNGESSDGSSSNSTNYDSNGDIDLASPNRSSSSGGGIDLASNSKPSYYSPPYSTPVQNWTDKGGSGATSGNQGYTSGALDAARRKADAASQGIKDINAALEAARKRAGYASGIGYIQDDQIAVVGENPHQEIVLGSKVNNGQLMSLGKGSGVVNAKGTNTLADILNQFGKFGASKFGQGNGVLNNNTNNESLIINGVTIQGANISDPQSFVNGLLSLKAEALQRAYKAH